MQIIKASYSDCFHIFKWRNDRLARNNFINSKKTSFLFHKIWFIKQLKSKQSEIFIAVHKFCKVGVCRFDICLRKNKAEISINLNPMFRGKRISKEFLKKSIEKFEKRYTLKLTAKIKYNNFSSKKIFTSLGFVQKSDNALLNYYEKTPRGY